MTTTQKVLLLGGGVLLFNTLSKAQSAGNLNFYPEGVSNINVSGGSPVMTVKVLVQNVGNTRLTLRSVAGNVYANNFLIGNGQNFFGLNVAPNSQVVLNINFQLSWLGIVQDIVNVFNGNGAKQIIEWDASINIDSLPVQSTKLKFMVG